MLDSEPDPFDLVEFLTRRFAPPVLQNTEGDSLVFCQATLRTDDSVALSKLLDKTYDRADPAEPEWIEHVTTDGMQRIRATLRLEGGDLQAADDPTRRDDLIRLLDSFPAATGPGMMSPDRLRAALGLPT